VRPGKPNKAASGFFSNIIREPLAGHEAILPVDDTVRHWHASPRAAVNFLVQAAGMGGAALGNRRALTLPGLSCTVAEQLAALERIAGKTTVQRVRREPDAAIRKIVSGWPTTCLMINLWKTCCCIPGSGDSSCCQEVVPSQTQLRS
jgi:nucleoside-diphosphate-sugar epimerase